MWMKPGEPRQAFTATEHFEIDRVAFSWRARFPVLGPRRWRWSTDTTRGRGLLELRVSAYACRARQAPELGQGESQRYLAELPWAPQAMARKRRARVGEPGDGLGRGGHRVAGGRAAVTFEFDGAGDIVRVSAVRRRQVGKSWEETPWGGDFGEYEMLGGVAHTDGRRGLLGARRRPVRVLARDDARSSARDDVVVHLVELDRGFLLDAHLARVRADLLLGEAPERFLRLPDVDDA